MSFRNWNPFLSIFSMAAILGSASAIQAADRMRSGQWEVTVIDGSQTRTNTHCDKPEEVRLANGSPEGIRASLEKSAASLHCTLQDFKMKGSNVSYTYACPGRVTKTRTSYHGDTFETVVTTSIGGKDHTRQIKGRRLGECP